jgi:hypothetical protein
MGYYCSISEVGSRLGLNNAQRTQASSKLKVALRRASIEIDQEFRDYGRNAPSGEVGNTTLATALLTDAVSVALNDASGFGTSGDGNIDGDAFEWTGKSGNTLTGCTGVSVSHASGVTVQGGEMTHILAQICADLAAAFYMEDEAGTISSDRGGEVMRERGTTNLKRLAHLGVVNG